MRAAALVPVLALALVLVALALVARSERFQRSGAANQFDAAKQRRLVAQLGACRVVGRARTGGGYACPRTHPWDAGTWDQGGNTPAGYAGWQCAQTQRCAGLVHALYANGGARTNPVRFVSSRAPQVEKRTSVGLFVTMWHDIPQPVRRLISSKDVGHREWAWWGPPAWGGGDLNKYTWRDARMVDYHIDRWIELGVDFIFVDLTNGVQSSVGAGKIDALRRVLDRLVQRQEGPRVVLWIDSVESIPWYAAVVYQQYRGTDVFWKLHGKPLLMVSGRLYLRRAPPAVKHPLFTVRWCWGLMPPSRDGTMWSYKNTRPTPPYMVGSEPEHMGVTFASQGTYMSMPAGRRCRENGAFFEQQAAAVRRVRPRVVTIHSYNEWMMPNVGDEKIAIYADQFSPECSSDIEPMHGGHGRRYFDQAKRFVRSL